MPIRPLVPRLVPGCVPRFAPRLATAVLAGAAGLAAMTIPAPPAGAGEHWPPATLTHELPVRPLSYAHADAVRELAGRGIGVWSTGRCADRRRPVCTSLEGVRARTVSGLSRFAAGSRCPVTVSGGTEIGHGWFTFSHWNGYKIDIRPNRCVDDHIARRFVPIGTRGDGARLYLSADGGVYADEGSHWDIFFP